MRKATMRAVSWSAVLVSAVVVSAGSVAPAAYAEGAAPEPAAGSDCAPLPAWVQGEPAHLHAGGATGDYLWHDGTGWHLRVTHPSKRQKVFTGVIKASNPITFAKVKDERRDKVTLSSDKTRLVFRFVNYGGIDGVDFTDACATKTSFAFAIAGHKATRNQVYIGGHSARPPAVPFTISRRSAAPAA